MGKHHPETSGGCPRLQAGEESGTDRHAAYHQLGEKTSYKATDAALSEWKRGEDLAFLSEVSSVPLQQTLRHQHTAFSNFFAGCARYPRFKSRNGRQSAHYTRSAFRIREGRLLLAKQARTLEVAWSWPDVDLAALNPTMVVVSREPDGRFYVTFAVDTDDPEPAPETGRQVGANLARYQRRMARKTRGSNNRRKAKRKVAVAHRKVRHARQDFLHKTTTRLVREHDLVAIEDLNIRGMTASARGTLDKPGKQVAQKRGLNRSVSDAALGEFRRQLEYKAHRAGRTVAVVDRRFPSSKTCSTCGHLLAELSLKTRAWTCPACRTRHDRDVNAAKNILAAGRVAARELSGDAGPPLCDPAELARQCTVGAGAGVSRQGSSLPRSATKQETGPVRAGP